MARKFLWWSGIAIMVTGLLLVARVPYFFARSAIVGMNLIRNEQSQLKRGGTPGGIANRPSGSQREASPLALLQVPQLHLTAPILQGDGDAVLSVAVGHLPDSVMPGQLGLAVLAAHNATWFRNINKLHSGSLIYIATQSGRYEFQVLHAQIVRTGTPVANTRSASVMLETCYPLNALYLTPYRYLVTATLVKQTARRLSYQSLAKPRGVLVNYTTARNLTFIPSFTNSDVPMGSLTYTHDTPLSYEDSPAPLSAANLMARLYAAFLKESEVGDTKKLQTLLVHIPAQNPLWHVPLSAVTYQSAFAVTLDVSRTSLVSVKSSVWLRVSGQLVHVVLVARNRHNQLSLETAHFAY